MDTSIGSSFALLCEEEGEVDMSKLTVKAESLKAEKRRMEILQASRERKAQLGFSFYENEVAPEGQDEEESSSSQVTKSELKKPEKNTKKEKKTELEKPEKNTKKEKRTKKKEHEVIKQKKNPKANLIKDYRKPVVEEQMKKTRGYFKPRTWKSIKMTIIGSIVVAILMAVLPERKEIVFN